MPDPILVPDGQILTVTADAGSYGTVWQEGTPHQWSVGAKSPLRLGAGLYRVETVLGKVSASVDSATVAALTERLPRATAIVSSAATIAGAIMIKDKFARLAERAKAVPAALGERADAVLGRLDRVEERGGAALGGLERVVDEAEQAAQSAEDAVSQISNGAPAA